MIFMLKFLFVCGMNSSIREGFVTKSCERQYKIFPSKTSNEEVIQINTFPLHIFSQYAALTASAAQ